MRICIDGRYITDHYPGIGRYTYNLIRELGRVAGDSTLFVLIRPDAPNTRFDLGALSANDAVRLVAVDVGLTAPRQHIALRSLARDLQLDLFHAPSWTAPLLMSCPVVLTLHDLIPLVFPGALRGYGRRLAYRTMVHLAVKRCAAVVVDSEATRRDLAGHCGYRGDATVVPLAADPSFAPIESERTNAVLQRLRIRRPYVLYVGTNKPHKNLMALLRAWVGMQDHERNGHTLVWAGAAEVRRPLESRYVADHAERGMMALGAVAAADLAPLYSGATCVVVPSLYEGFGLPMLEAMACGTPVLCAQQPALLEVSGDAALTFDPRQPEGLRLGLARMLADGDLRRNLAELGRSHVLSYSWERTAAATLAVYRRVLGEREKSV